MAVALGVRLCTAQDSTPSTAAFFRSGIIMQAVTTDAAWLSYHWKTLPRAERDRRRLKVIGKLPALRQTFRNLGCPASTKWEDEINALENELGVSGDSKFIENGELTTPATLILLNFITERYPPTAYNAYYVGTEAGEIRTYFEMLDDGRIRGGEADAPILDALDKLNYAAGGLTTFTVLPDAPPQARKILDSLSRFSEKYLKKNKLTAADRRELRRNITALIAQF